MATFKITLAYDGTEFVGWQRQANGVSIQGLIEDALADLDGAPVAVAGAGRTDAGVHALGQVASFSLARAIDGASVHPRAERALPAADSRRSAAADVAADFPRALRRPRRRPIGIGSATGEVLDPFERSYAWHVPAAARRRRDGARRASSRRTRTISRRFRLPAANAEHRPSGSSRDQLQHASRRTPRTRRKRVAGASVDSVSPVSSAVQLITYEITGNGFLRHMVRTIVGSLVEIGRGRRDERWLGCVHGVARSGDRPDRPRRPRDCSWLASTTTPTRLRLSPKSLYNRGLLRR